MRKQARRKSTSSCRSSRLCLKVNSSLGPPPASVFRGSKSALINDSTLVRMSRISMATAFTWNPGRQGRPGTQAGCAPPLLASAVLQRTDAGPGTVPLSCPACQFQRGDHRPHRVACRSRTWRAVTPHRGCSPRPIPGIDSTDRGELPHQRAPKRPCAAPGGLNRELAVAV